METSTPVPGSGEEISSLPRTASAPSVRLVPPPQPKPALPAAMSAVAPLAPASEADQPDLADPDGARLQATQAAIDKLRAGLPGGDLGRASRRSEFDDAAPAEAVVILEYPNVASRVGIPLHNGSGVTRQHFDPVHRPSRQRNGTVSRKRLQRTTSGK